MRTLSIWLLRRKRLRTKRRKKNRKKTMKSINWKGTSRKCQVASKPCWRRHWTRWRTVLNLQINSGKKRMRPKCCRSSKRLSILATLYNDDNVYLQQIVICNLRVFKEFIRNCQLFNTQSVQKNICCYTAQCKEFYKALK